MRRLIVTSLTATSLNVSAEGSGTFWSAFGAPLAPREQQ